MITYPNAKINLGLNVLEKRPDGFHNIETVFYPVPFCDILEIIPLDSAKTTFTSSGLLIPGPPDQNICLKALGIFSSSHPTLHSSLYTLHLHKEIPSGAGLGGGSSDGAFTLKMLNELTGAGFPDDRLEAMAAKLGSDCPFFIRNRPVFASGRGEVLSEIDVNLSGYYLALVIPPVHVSTAEAYAMITPAKPAVSINEVVVTPPSEWKDKLVNDFEGPVIAKYPEIGKVKEKLYDLGAVYASMSGSGSAVYGLFTSPPPHLPTYFGADLISRIAMIPNMILGIQTAR